MTTHQERLERAYLALDGLSVGDSLGGFLEGSTPGKTAAIVKDRQPPDGEWRYTDDSNMASSICAILRQHQKIEQDALAKHFADHFQIGRGYGPGASRLLRQLQEGGKWRELAPGQFGTGSYGNGSSMRVAPLGAYFADDMQALIENARLQSEITHAHPEGIAGAIAVAVAAATAWQIRNQNEAVKPSREQFIDAVLEYVPVSEVRSQIKFARDIKTTSISHVVQMIGNGAKLSAQDTVPLAIYCAGEWLNDYEEAIWQTMTARGDTDTLCAIVGGIVVMYAGREAIPSTWLEHREPLPDWIFAD